MLYQRLAPGRAGNSPPHQRAEGPTNSAVDLEPSGPGDASHYNEQAVEMTRAVLRQGRNAKVRTGCDKEFS
jgi:hypothetical protein